MIEEVTTLNTSLIDTIKTTFTRSSSLYFGLLDRVALVSTPVFSYK
nr:MAG TPA: hypothetical protein [Caudoviricetes sp.]